MIFRENWLEIDVDRYVRVLPTSAQAADYHPEHNEPRSCTFSMLAGLERDGEEWVARFVDEPTVTIRHASLKELMIDVDHELDITSPPPHTPTSPHAPAVAVSTFREAQSRAQNVAHDLEGLEWDRGPHLVYDGLLQIRAETQQVLDLLIQLTQDKPP